MKRFLSCLLFVGLLAGWIAWQLRTTKQSPVTANRIFSASPPVLAAPGSVPSWLRSQPALSSRRSAEEELTRALRSGSAAERDRAFSVLLPNLVALDPSLAGHMALAWESGPLRDELLAQVIRRWTATDLGGVLNWMSSFLGESDRRIAAQALTAQVAQDDPAGAIELGLLLHVGLDDGSLEHRIQLWTTENPGEALGWLVRRPADAVRDRLLARMAWTLAQTDPAEAAGLVLNHMTPGEARDDALLGIVRQWAVQESIHANAWVASFPAGPLNTRASAELEVADRHR